MIALTPGATKHAIVNVIDGACPDPDRIESMLAVDGIVLVHALLPALREKLLGGRALAFCADAHLSPSQLDPLREAAAAFSEDHGILPEAGLPAAMAVLRDGLARALTADSGLSVTITAASRRFGICLHLQDDGGEATLNAAGLGLGVWSLRCQQPVHIPVLRADARAAQGLDYCPGSGEEGLPAITVPCGERVVDGTAMWLVLSARGAALADPAEAETKRVLLEALARALTTQVAPTWEGRRARLFRAEALAEHNDDIRLLPLQLLLAPSWTRRGVQVLAAGLVLLVIALFVPVRDRFGTSAPLGLDDVVSVSATAPGRIQSLTAIPGQHVAGGAPLARLSDTAAAAEAERAYADYVALLRRRLAHADAAAADPELAQAWERLQQAQTAALPQLRAPGPGRILDLSVSRGQEVVAGQSLMQFAPDGGAAQLDLDLPGRAASELHAGATGIARLASMPDHAFPIRVAWVAQTIANGAASASAGTGQTEPHVHARAVFTGEQPRVLPGTRADVRVDLGSKPLIVLLYQRWMEG